MLFRSIIQRLADHENRTNQVVQRYKERQNVSIIDGTGTIEEVNERICTDLENRFKHLKEQ